MKNEDRTIDTPLWAQLNKSDLTKYDLTSIVQGGCESGAHMDAVTYHTALATMAEHGDDVMEYLEEADFTLQQIVESAQPATWGQVSCAVLSTAIELWSDSALRELEREEEEEADAEEEERAVVHLYELTPDWQKIARSNLGECAVEAAYIEPCEHHLPSEHVLIDLNECMSGEEPGTGIIGVSNNSALKLTFNEAHDAATVEYI